MNERGSYGNGHSTNGYSSLAAGNGYAAYGSPYDHPSLGADVSPATKQEASGFFLRLFMMLGGALAGHVVAESKHKGAALGMVGGYFAALMLEQTSELKCINRQLSQR